MGARGAAGAPRPRRVRSNAEVCTISSDGRDPALAQEDREAGRATVWGRTVKVHLSDADNVAWASIDEGDPGDEVWLDRSFDGGLTWEPDGGKLGLTKIPEGAAGTRTMLVDVDVPAARRIGAIRACGRAGDRPEIACTPWVRSTVAAATPIDAAATALMQFYDQDTGLWRTTGWWNSANALTSMLDYSRHTGSTTYRYAVGLTFEKHAAGGFTNEFLDDTGWWGLAWIRAYDLTGEQRYLDMARHAADYMWSYEDDHCGGGLWWKTDKRYKNAITNELFVKLAASLHNRIAGDTTHLTRARDTWQWFDASGLINAQHLVNDGLDFDTCRNNQQTTWTYNQGVILGGLVELQRATGDTGLLTRARQIADAATTDPLLNPGGVLREPCEGGTGDCGADGPSFKGVFVRNLAELDRAVGGRPYHDYLRTQADSVYSRDRNPLDQYGLHWAGPYDGADAARQHAALDALTAVL